MGEPDFSTPTAALRTFQEAFRRDAVDIEFECFSQVFKDRQGNLDYESYYDFRYQFVDEHPVAAFLFNLNDLDNNVVNTDYRSDGKTARLDLRVAGEDHWIDFILETEYFLEYFGEDWTARDIIPEPHTKIFRKGNQIEIDVPLNRQTRNKDLGDLRKLLLEKRWKFLDFSFVHENIEALN